MTVFRHADVVAVANDPVTFSSAASAFRSVPNTLDPPEHGRFRAVVDRFFTPERMAGLEPVVRDYCVKEDIICTSWGSLAPHLSYANSSYQDETVDFLVQSALS